MTDQHPAPVGDAGFVRVGELFHPHQPPHLWAPGVAYQKFLEKSDWFRHAIGAPLVPGQGGVEWVTGGYRQRHERGALYLESRADAEPYALTQSIAYAYDLLGNTRSFLGFPTDDFHHDPAEDDAFVAYFDNGYIFSWADVGAVPIRELLIKFTGFHCFGETDEPSDSDEPYFINGVVPIVTGDSVSSMSRIYDDVDAGTTVPDDFLMFQGPPQAVSVTITLFEHDLGDPNEYKALVDQALDKAAEAATAAVATIPVVGTPSPPSGKWPTTSPAPA